MIKGIGIDVVDNARVKPIIAKTVLTPAELVVYQTHHNPLEYLASRFCVKEAIIKATNKAYSFLDIEIKNDADGKPYCSNIDGLLISISHEKDLCVCFCIWEEA